MNPWSMLRSRFNHDWLKNHYLVALGSWVDYLEADEGERRDEELERTFVEESLPQWERRRTDAVEIVAQAPAALSPRHLFDRPPLSRCPPAIRDALAELSHRLWLTRARVKSRLEEVNSIVGEVDTAYAELRRQLEKCPDKQSRAALRPFTPAFRRLRDACQGLARALERLPQEIRST